MRNWARSDAGGEGTLGSVEISGNMEIAAIVLTFVVHVIAAGVLVWALIDHDRDDAGSWRDWWPKDGREPEPPAEPWGPGGDGVKAPILPDAQPSPVRLRTPGRIAEHHAPARRPMHPPLPERPAREREPA